MNRWTASALAVLILGLVLAFLVVPFDHGDCPTPLDDCTAYGSVPRIATIAVSVVVALVLTTIGSVGPSRRRT